MKKEATFAAGCFWGVESVFRALPGVTDTRVGYTGGQLAQPTYEDVCTGATGHAEAVEVIYESEEISFEQLLGRFWDSHDPTTPDRQGPDRGTQYRSVIFYHNEEQRRLAEASRETLDRSGRWKAAIVTDIAPAGPFYEAEAYHQRYFEKRGIAPACPS